MKALLDNVIDGVIKNMEESIVEGEFGKFYDFSAGDTGLEKENSILIQQVWDLEKKNETLVNCVTQIRGYFTEFVGKQYLDSLREKKSKKKCVVDSKTEQMLNGNSTAEVKAENMRNYIESLSHDIKQYNGEINGDQKDCRTEEVFNNSKRKQ
ncbi:CAP-Gly domain-containing protein [Caerostris extrusa]|uniref:CAP-Gly domain-containing protein n=1 Tax=Caerostris extrusa TaxID=172846 RepID=A0AAV4PI46_CAEEX|nr:CAP-Gly domain-containing protein [Caerostris extrusa]